MTDVCHTAPVSGAPGFRLVDVEERDLLAVVKVHGVAFPGFFLSQLGAVFLHAMYFSFYLRQEKMFLAIKDEAGAVVGFAVGGGVLSASELVRRFILEPRLLTAWLRAVFGLSPGNLGRILGRYRKVRATSRVRSAKCWLHSIAVLPEFQGAGFGRLLLNSFESRLRLNRVDRYVLTTDKADNEATLRFYLAAGFSVVEELDASDGRRMALMEKKLETSA